MSTEPKPDYYKVVQEHRALIYRVCHLFYTSEEDLKDLFQEIILNIGLSLPGFKGQSKLSTWIYRIAINTAITYSKKNKPRHTALDDIAFSLVEQELSLLQSEEYKLMMREIEQLPAIEKAIVLLYLDNLSYQEISQITGLSVSNVGVKINRIKEKLRKQLYHKVN